MNGESPLSDARLRHMMLLAARAGPIREPLRVLSDEELEAPIEIDLQPDLPPTDDTHNAPLPEVPGYRLNTLLDVGGQAAVYQALHEPTGRAVALKIFHGGRYLTADARRRLDREVQALASLHHPGIVAVLDRGRTADGSFYLATDLVAGRPLDQHASGLRAGNDHRGVISLFVQIASAVQAIHDAGLVHRDLKPANVLVATGEAGAAGNQPYLIDFGLARHFSPAGRGPGMVTVTAAGQILGTLPWASPEQAEGDSVGLDPRSDIYSFGVLLYHALTGQYPYRVQGTISEVLDTIRRTSPVLLSQRRIKMGGLDTGHLDRILARAMAKSPEDRYQTMEALSQDLQRLLAGLEISRPRRSKRVWQGWRLPLLASLLSGGSIVLWLVGSREAPVVPMLMPTHETRTGIRLVLLEGGQFQMGSLPDEEGRDNDERRHSAVVEKPFWIATTEVTRGQYRRVMEGATVVAADDDLPMTDVLQEQAAEFCRRLSVLEGHVFRLPDEAEWEYACRAGAPGRFSGTAKLESMGWYAGNSDGRLHPVKLKSPNPWGLFDMHGNAREWCRDGYTDGYQRQVARMDRYQPVVRGGSFRTPVADCRSAARESVSDIGHADDLGFRVVMERRTEVGSEQ